MARQKRITTRELLRNFKGLKDLLLQGKVHHLVVDVGNDRQLELSVRRGPNAARDVARRFGKPRRPIHISRVGLFEGLLAPRVRRP